MIIKKIIPIILLLTILSYVNGSEYCTVLVSCKHDVQQQFQSCIKNVLKIFSETETFPENFVDADKCKKAAQFFEKLTNNSVLVKHNETLSCVNNKTISDNSLKNGTNLKCSILESEIENKYVFKTIGKPNFEECLNQKMLADERCDVLNECCPPINKCNSFYNEDNQQRYKNMFSSKSQTIKNCFYNHKVALANPERIVSPSKAGQTEKVIDAPLKKNDTLFDIDNNELISNVITSTTTAEVAKKEGQQETTTKKVSNKKKNLKRKLKSKTHAHSDGKKKKSNKKQKEIYRLDKDVARKVFASWGCNSVDVLKSLINVSEQKCSRVRDGNVKDSNAKMPSIELIENILKKDQKILTAHCVRDFKEFGGKCSDETNLAPYDEIGDNIQFCRNYDILDSYKEILDSENDTQECHIRHSKFKLYLYKLKNCCLWSFKTKF
uniref:CPG4 domain-containing protein n=1 Tax=Strongyloides venezuelensis TaxID=75913 RepID=A0A0K0G2H1_STRVS